jgi:hypothetical protein
MEQDVGLQFKTDPPPREASEILVAVRDDLGCLYYHLLENPMTLCDIEYRYTAARTTADSPGHRLD